jgi:hypothetical protein
MKTISRKLLKLIPGTHLAEYQEELETNGRIIESVVTISYLWDESPESLEF